jgi:hypothetical protein
MATDPAATAAIAAWRRTFDPGEPFESTDQSKLAAFCALVGALREIALGYGRHDLAAALTSGKESLRASCKYPPTTLDESRRLYEALSAADDAVNQLEKLSPPAARTPPSTIPRLVCDHESQTVTLDGKVHDIDDAKAFGVYQTIAEAPQWPITNRAIRSKVKGLNGRHAVRRRIEMLPAALRATIKTSNAGHALKLPSRKLQTRA